MNAGAQAPGPRVPVGAPQPASGALGLLVARDVSVTPPGSREPAVRGISLSVAAGEWVALAGPNGGGKTSLLLGLSGLWPISGGTLELDGAPFGPESRGRVRADVAVVLQDPSSQLLQPTVAEELCFAARNLGHQEFDVVAAAEHWSAALGLAGELGREPATLSAGRQQLVLLAAALVAGPRLLLADEPTAHLDADARARVREVIAERVREGLAVVWATQDQEEWHEAARTLTIGAIERAGHDRARPHAPRSAAVVLRIGITPAETEEGPRIRLGRAVEIAVSDRGVTALLGPNGVGKSVLLAAAAGVAPLPQVAAEWVIAPAYPPIVTLQYPELQIFEERVADELVFAAVARGMRRSDALDAAVNCLENLGFDPPSLLGKQTWLLSAGEKRAIEVVAALIAPAGMVLLDEPTAGLDRDRSAALAELVVARGEKGPVLLASQDSDWVASLGAATVVLG